MANPIKKAGNLNSETYAIYLALRDARTPGSAKAVALLTLVYLFFPADIIPDAIPVIGWLDDIGIGYLLTKFAQSMVPQPIMDEARAKAEKSGKKIWRTIIIVLIALTIFWLVILIAFFSAIITLLGNLVDKV